MAAANAQQQLFAASASLFSIFLVLLALDAVLLFSAALSAPIQPTV
jgi:hypothetical protein